MSYGGESTFWSCFTGEDDHVNIYTQPAAGNCSEITLVADSCVPTCINGVPQPPPSPPDISSPPPPPPPSPSSSEPPPNSSPETSTNTDTTSSSLVVTPFLSSTPPDSSTTQTTATTPTSPPSPPPPPPPSSSPPPPPPQPAPSICPTDVPGDGWEYPHLMVPVDRANPGVAYAPSFVGQLSPNASTLYNFDIPASDGGRTCSLFFAFPSAADVDPSAYTFAGSSGGAAGFAFLAGAAGADTTFDSAPAAAADLGAVRLSPGNRYVIASFPCPAGRRISFALREPDGADTCLYYFQDILPAPFGLYISKC